MKLNAIFSDNMVLQANKPVYVFGSGHGKVTVEISGNVASVVSSNDNWLVELPTFDYGGPYDMAVNLDGETKILHDVYFGDVYLFSGQSNNQFKLWQSTTPKEYYRDNDSIRLFTVDRLEDQGHHVLTEDGWKSIDKNGNVVTLQGEHYESQDGWIKATEDEVQFWSALGYLVGDELTNHSDRKIGIIACYQGASVIQSWLPEHYLDETEFFIPWELRSAGARNPDFALWNANGKLYNGMITHILPYSMKAVIWYQGEANSSGEDAKPGMYSGMLKLLIDKWREDFKDEDLAFIVVQLHDYMERLSDTSSGWNSIQREQEAVCKMVNNAYLVKCADVCETNDIHPPTKLPLALRIADVLEKI